MRLTKAVLVANKLVELIEVAEMFAGLKLVADRFVKNALVEVILVPEAVANTNAPPKFAVPEI